VEIDDERVFSAMGLVVADCFRIGDGGVWGGCGVDVVF
jgi:hypothetical protein